MPRGRMSPGSLVELKKPRARTRPKLLGIAIFAQATGSYGPNPWGDAAHHAAELFKDPHAPDDPVFDPTEPFSTVGLVKCNYVSFKPEIPKGMRAVIEVEGNEQASDPKYGAIDIYVTPKWTPNAGGQKPPGDPRTTFGGNGGLWVSGPGRLTVHLLTDIIPAPKVKVRLEPMP